MKPITRRASAVLIVATALVAVPTVVLAATGTFTSSTNRPAITGVNTSAQAGAAGVTGQASGGGAATRFGVSGSASGTGGIGVQGTGAKFGVYSNGPLGVAPGRPLVCSGCVTAGDLTLVHGQSESGVFAAAEYAANPGDYVAVGITFPRPLAAAVPDNHIIDTNIAPSAHCTGIGHAAPGYLCLYPTGSNFYEVSTTSEFDYGFAAGAQIFWTPTNNNPYVGGVWTLTAP